MKSFIDVHCEKKSHSLVANTEACNAYKVENEREENDRRRHPIHKNIRP